MRASLFVVGLGLALGAEAVAQPSEPAVAQNRMPLERLGLPMVTVKSNFTEIPGAIICPYVSLLATMRKAYSDHVREAALVASDRKWAEDKRLHGGIVPMPDLARHGCVFVPNGRSVAYVGGHDRSIPEVKAQGKHGVVVSGVTYIGMITHN